jgi:hypothetical protein
MLPALLYLTVRNPPWYVWVLNLTIAIVYFAVAILGSIGAVRFIVLVRDCYLICPVKSWSCLASLAAQPSVILRAPGVALAACWRCSCYSMQISLLFPMASGPRASSHVPG